MKLLLLLLLCPILAFSQIKAGDSILISEKALTGISPDYNSRDEWYATMLAYIPRMAGRTYKVHKVARGYIYLRVKEIQMNDWTPMKFKVDYDLSTDSSVIKK